MLKLEGRSAPSSAWGYGSPLLALFLTLISGGLMFEAMGHDALLSLHLFFITPLADLYNISELLLKATPLLLCALGVALCYRATFWNIGAEGQFLMGGLGASAMALQIMEVDAFWVLPAVIAAGMISGMFWAAIATGLKLRFNSSEILTTIMLNYIALNLLLWAVHGPLKDPNGFNFPESALFADNVLMPLLFNDYRLHWGLGIALLAFAVSWLLISRSFVGFQIKVTGLNPFAARFAGFQQARLAWLVMLSCGALAGLAGAMEVSGPIGQLVPNISPGYGYSAIIIAFIGRLHPAGILLGGLLMALIYMGGELVQIELGIPAATTGLFQGMLLFFLLACDVLIRYRVRWSSAPLLKLPLTKRVN